MNNQDSNTLVEVENKYWKDLNISLKALHENSHFQKVILGSYFTDKAVNGVSMLADPETIRGGKRGELMESLVAISHLQDHFITIANLGASEDDLASDDEDLNAFTPEAL
jgi:hypothetical protein